MVVSSVVPHVLVTVRFEGVFNVCIAEVTYKSVSITFDNSSSITITKLSVNADSGLFPIPNTAAITAIKTSISLIECEFLCTGLLNSYVTSNNSDILVWNFSQVIDSSRFAIVLFNSTMTLQGNVKSLGDLLLGSSSAISLYDSTLINEGSATFYGGFAIEGGAISGKGDSAIYLRGTVTFTENSASKVGGAIAIKERSRMVIEGNVSFFSCQSSGHGAAIAVEDSGTLIINGTANFTQSNSILQCHIGGAIYLSGDGSIILDGDITFSNNQAIQGGAIGLIGSSSLVMHRAVTFIGNNATHGGAIAIMGNRTILFPEPSSTQISFVNNIAFENGGGMYFLPPSLIDESQCVFSFGHLPMGTIFNFTNNMAGRGGDAIYNAFLQEDCIMPSGVIWSNFSSIIQRVSFFLPSFATDTSLISSDPISFCFCRDGKCDIDFTPTLHVYPGELFEFSAAVLGDMNGLVSYSVQTFVGSLPTGTGAKLGDRQDLQTSSNRNCTNFIYSILTHTRRNFYCQLWFSFHLPYHVSTTYRILVLMCPLGFVLNSEAMQCECAWPLSDITVSCNISGKSIQRQGTTWIGVLEQNASDASVVYSTSCPFSYCSEHRVNILAGQMFDEDAQCSDGRSGILCGDCRANHSLALGSNKCLPGCNNRRLTLIIAFAAAGIALVFFIKILNLTISQGTLNGLIFYANIIGAQPSLYFPTGSSPCWTISTFFSMFIAWLNLDLGIQTCFYEGMDAFAKAWLQFVFPVYVWIIALVVILLSHYSTHASRLFGNNSVPVLATLILLSYAKLLRAVISPLSISHIESLNGTKIYVWERNGNIRYLTGQHIPLFILALIVIVLVLIPFTLVLLGIQWLNRGTHYRVLCWVTKLKPFFDAFTGPLKDKHHYWVGVLLLVRCVLLLVFSLSNGNSTALVSIIFISSTILAVTYSVYRSMHLTILERSYILNLEFLAAGSLYIQYKDHGIANQEALVITSVGIAFLQFVAIVIYHGIVQLQEPLKKFKAWRSITNVKNVGGINSIDAKDPEESQPFLRHDRSGFRESLLAYLD